MTAGNMIRVEIARPTNVWLLYAYLVGLFVIITHAVNESAWGYGIYMGAFCSIGLIALARRRAQCFTNGHVSLDHEAITLTKASGTRQIRLDDIASLRVHSDRQYEVCEISIRAGGKTLRLVRFRDGAPLEELARCLVSQLASRQTRIVGKGWCADRDGLAVGKAHFRWSELGALRFGNRLTIARYDGREVVLALSVSAPNALLLAALTHEYATSISKPAFPLCDLDKRRDYLGFVVGYLLVTVALGLSRGGDLWSLLMISLLPIAALLCFLLTPGYRVYRDRIDRVFFTFGL